MITLLAGSYGFLKDIPFLDSDTMKEVYFDNTLRRWLGALGIILLSIILSRVLYWIFGRVVRSFTKKTKNKFDDIVVDMIEKPTVYTIIATGIWFGLKLLRIHPAVDSAIDNSFSVVLSLLVAWVLCRLFDTIHEAFLKPWAEKTDNDLDDQLMPVIRKGVKIIVWIMAIVIGLDNAGHDVGALLAGLGIGGLALAMAAKDTVSNFFGGVTIFTDQPFKMNDRIKVAGFDGTVSEIGMRSTRLTTLEGRQVTIPNMKFADAPVENVSREPNRKIVVNLGMTYDTNAEQMQKAQDMLIDICTQHEGTEEKIITSFNGFGDFALNIMFIYYIKKDEDIAGVQNAINMQILKQFADEGLEFAFPTQTIHNVQVK